MIHPFSELQSDYANCLAHLSVTRPLQVDQAAKKVLQNLNRYTAATLSNGVPSIFIGVLDLRESDCDPRLALGQGDPWNQVSRHVPRGFGPFSSWSAAATFYIHYDHLDDATQPWSLEYACWKGEIWNGFGPRAHGRRTGYLWAGTNLYDPPTGLGGKYVEDGKWSPGTVDQQLGIIPVLLRIGQLRPDLAIGHSLLDHTPTQIPPISAPSVSVAQNPISVKQMQHMLNVVAHANIDEDGSYGRETRFAVRAYQQEKGLGTDGLFGPATQTQLTTDYNKLMNGDPK